MALAVGVAAASLGIAAGSAAAQDKVRAAAAAINIAHAPIALAAAQPDIFKAHGIDLEVTDSRGQSANCIAALISEAVELCQVGTTTGTDAIAEGADLVAVAVVAGLNGEFILSKDVADKLGVKADAPTEERIKALKGLNIVTSQPGSAYYTLFDSMMKTVGMSIGDIKYRPLADVPSMIEGIRNGAIEGALWTVGSLSPVVLEGKAVRWISFARGDVEFFQGLPFITVYARRDWAEANPDLVKRVHDGFVDSIKRLHDQPEQSAAAIKDKYFPDLDPAVWKDGYDQTVATFIEGATVNAESWQKSLDIQKQTTGKDYSGAAFDKVVLSVAQAK
jgi:ABC-type nitrate/sulfonate/bicarbonate transport system substrate-binding protein